jgi:hypothetical protein
VHTMQSAPLLRNALLADAAITAATGLLLVLGASTFAGPLGLPGGLLRGAGLFLLPFAVAVWAIGSQMRPPRAALWTVIGFNAVWAVDSLLLPLSGWVRPTGLGHAFILAQALAVAALAGLQWQGLRRSAWAAA